MVVLLINKSIIIKKIQNYFRNIFILYHCSFSSIKYIYIYSWKHWSNTILKLMRSVFVDLLVLLPIIVQEIRFWIKLNFWWCLRSFFFPFRWMHHAWLRSTLAIITTMCIPKISCAKYGLKIKFWSVSVSCQIKKLSGN